LVLNSLGHHLPADIRQVMTEAIQNWSNDVKNGQYPNEDESYGLTEETKKEIAAS
jgi:ketopantoate hydroxymethyltransferase